MAFIHLPPSGGSGEDSLLRDKYVRTTRFEIISSGTSGTITAPGNSEIVLDDFGGATDAVVSQVDSGKPSIRAATDANMEIIGTSFDSFGNWILSGVPSSYPVAILYRVRQRLEDFDSTSADIWGNTNTIEPSSGLPDEVSPVFTYDLLGRIERIDYASASYKLFEYDIIGRLEVIDYYPNGSSSIIRKTFNYLGDNLISIDQTVV